MKNKLFVLAAFAIALSSCSKESETLVDSTPISKDNTAVTTQQPVLFGAYVNRAVTRAGAEGVLTTNGTGVGQVSLESEGFGVFAYYTDDDLYSPIYQPNFMYNTKVSKSTATDWTYAPVRYWPNEFGSDASSEGVDRLSFFAYAPWVQVTPNTGIVTGDNTYGIVGLSRNAATGDPFVKYYSSLDPAKQVDFSWAVPQINMVKPNVTDVVNMQFNHALAALNVQVDAMIDESTPVNNTLDANTKIYVRSVTFEGLVTKGSFNLNSTKATWYDLAGANYIDGGSVTVYDGRTNGKEGQSESANESPVGLNPVVVQSQPYSGTPTAGVTNTAVNLFAGTTADAPLYVIPSGQPLNVTIVYDVETATDELAGYLSDGETHGTSVENKITKAISFGTSNKLEAGKLYKLTLHLGMTSVKFDATVAEWDESTAGSSADLPQNIISIGTVNLTSNGTPLTDVTVWKNQTSVAAPDVTVMGSDGNPLSGVTLSWDSDNPSVAAVGDDGVVALTGVSGTAKIIVTATKEGLDGSATASYDVNVNEITGISVTPATSNVGVGGKVTLNATLTHTNYGTVGTLPTISWISGSTDYVTISPSTGNSTQATGVAEGSSTITASVDEAYMKDGVSNSASGVVNCRGTLSMSFRGYWVSPGILYRDASGNYGLTNERDGDNFTPFELSSYFNNNGSLNQYYFKWFDLRNELGADGSNIDSDSDKLPGDWTFPTGTTNGIWNTIFNGKPKTEIKIGDTVLGTNTTTQPFAYVTVNDGTNTYRGILLLRDGAVVDVNLAKFGVNSSYSDNVLTYAELKKFLDEQCLFISITGVYNTVAPQQGWRDFGPTWFEGYYWSSTYVNDTKAGYYLATNTNMRGATSSSNGATQYRTVRLVKPANGPAPTYHY
ncbi:MAG: hypothetical protein IKP48_02990 [Bacteroidaceae bacterium]|nr:hypothetical protein [Bacteroidaceae bacterium]